MTRLNGQMFFMGAAFLLIETKSIAELSLLFGSTWVVNAAVFSAILIMVLAANLIVARLDARAHAPNLHIFYGLLLLSLVLAFMFPVVCGAYDIPVLYRSTDLVFTNKASTDAYRGAGRPVP